MVKSIQYFVGLLFLSLGFFFGHAQDNTLSKKEKKEGWKLLFDGQTTKGWRKFKGDKPGSAWKVEQGSLVLDPSDQEGRGDLMTEEEFENFELSLEWKISDCGNSGIIFFIQEAEQHKTVWVTGPEMQVLDNTCHPDAKIIKHRAGDLYDLISCSKEVVKPAGEWNTVKIRAHQNHLQLWLNGVKVVETILNDQKWDDLVAGSKFKSMKEFSKKTKGHIALQDHGDKVWFRNIKIRPSK